MVSKMLFTILFAIACLSGGTVIKVRPQISNDEFELPTNLILRSTGEITSQWGPHIMDFLDLIDLEKVMVTAMQYLNDPEVMTFVKFLISPQFKQIIWDFETMDEFKESYAFLASKGYDMETVMNFVNSALDLPPFQKPTFVTRNIRGISDFFESMVNALPLDDMKKVFETKLETSPEVAQLFETINSEEFMDIMRRMRKNPKFVEIQMVFESYGFDFKFLCTMAKEIFGDYYQGIFCE